MNVQKENNLPQRDYEIVCIGGSAGCLPTLSSILNTLPDNFCLPMVIVLHRLKNVFSEMDKILSLSVKKLHVKEPDDKTPIEPYHIYLAPQNYHLLAENEKCFSLDYSEQINYSRPSIDVTFKSISDAYKEKTLGILLSGANQDGAEGINYIIENKGTGIVQDPVLSEYPVMPQSAIKLNKNILVFSPEEIIQYLRFLNC